MDWFDSNNIAVVCAKSAHHQSAYQTVGLPDRWLSQGSRPPGKTSPPVCTITLCIAAAARTDLGKSTPCLTKQQLRGRRPRLCWAQCASSLAYISAIASWNACLAWGRLSLNVGVMRPFSTEKGSGVRYTACTCRAVNRNQRRLRLASETLQCLRCLVILARRRLQRLRSGGSKCSRKRAQSSAQANVPNPVLILAVLLIVVLL